MNLPNIQNPNTIIEVRIGDIWELQEQIKELKDNLKTERLTIKIQAKKLNSYDRKE